MELEIIVNPKQTDDGQPVIQLETACGAAIKHFRNAHGINVPRSRFLPVKSCSDLLLIKSDIYSLQHGQLMMSEHRLFGTSPVIKLGDHFKKVREGDLTSTKCEADQGLYVDPTIPEALQEDSQDYRARPSHCHGRRLLWPQRHSPRHCHQYASIFRIFSNTLLTVT